LQLPDYLHAKTYLDVNQHFSAPTMYEILNDHLTINIQGHTRRGVTYTIDNAFPTGVNYFLGMYRSVDARVGNEWESVAELANHVRRWPSIVMTYYPGVDEIAHRFSSASPEYRIALQDMDTIIGNTTDAIDRAGLGDSTYYVLCSDHGHVPSRDQQRWDVED